MVKKDEYKTINPATGKFWKYGDVRDDGYIFKYYGQILVSTKKYQLYFHSPEVFHKVKEANKKNNASQWKKTKLNPYPLRLNKKTGKPYEIGDAENGLFFKAYKQNNETTGLRGESWVNEEDFNLHRISHILVGIKQRSKGLGISTDLDLNYLLSIFKPKFYCPITGKETFFTNQAELYRPSLDKVEPNLGYVKGNVAWISKDGNNRKTDLTVDLIDILVKFYRPLETSYYRNYKSDYSNKSNLNKSVISRIKQAHFEIKRRATRRRKVPLSYELDAEYLISIFPEDMKCPILGIDLIFGKKNGVNSSPSLDRINNSDGYLKGNVVWVSNKANILKRNNSVEDLLAIKKYICEFQK